MATYVVKTGTALDSTGYNESRNMARLSDGTLVCVYHRSDGTRNQIYYAYSEDGGETWTEEAVTAATGTNHQYNPSVAVDSNDNVYVVWRGLGWGTYTAKYNIRYRKRTAGGWQAHEAVCDVNGDNYSSAIAVDSAGNVHVAWHGYGHGVNTGNLNVQYRKRTDSWQAQEAVTDEANDQYYCTIAIDSAGNVHLAWHGYGWDSYPARRQIEYRKRTDSWQAREAVTDVNNHQVEPNIALDSNDHVHVCWHGYDGSNYEIFYRKRTDSWQSQESVTSQGGAIQQFGASVEVDSYDDVYVAWHGLGWGTNTGNYNIQVSKRTGGTPPWPATPTGVTDRAYDNRYAQMIWGNYPEVGGVKTNVPKVGSALVFSGQIVTGYQVEYHASDDLEFQSAPAPAGMPGLSPSQMAIAMGFG